MPPRQKRACQSTAGPATGDPAESLCENSLPELVVVASWNRPQDTIRRCKCSINKKSRHAEGLKALQHVGLLVNKLSGTASLLFSQSSGDLEQVVGDGPDQYSP